MKTGDKSEAGFQACNLDSAKCVAKYVCVREGERQSERQGGGRTKCDRVSIVQVR